MKSNHTIRRFDLISNEVIKEIMSGASSKFRRHFARVYNGFEGIEIPKRMIEEILEQPEFENSIIYTNEEGRVQFLTTNALNDEAFLDYYQDFDKDYSLTGLVFVGINAFIEIKNKLNL